MEIALSTCWFHGPEDGVLASIRAAREIGVRAFEIGVTGTDVPVDEIASLVRGGEIRVVSVHNLCTRSRVLGKNARGDFLGHPSEGRRRETVRRTLETIDVARALGAGVVVVHLGETRMRSASRRQTRMGRYVLDLGRTHELTQEVQRLLRKRRDRALGAMDAVRRSLREIAERAPDVTIAAENRYYFHQLPLPDELDQLLREFPRLAYCHDVGHANALDAIGFVPHAEWLERFGPRIAEVHIHDVVQLVDHLPPGAGHFDFGMLRDRIPPSASIVMEVHDGYPPAQIAAAKRFLERNLSPRRSDPPPPAV